MTTDRSKIRRTCLPAALLAIPALVPTPCPTEPEAVLKRR